MLIADILLRSIFGYVFMIPGLLLYFVCLWKTGKKQTSCHIAAAFVFAYYLIGIFTVTGIHAFKAFSPRIVLIPFADMISGPVDTILNVILYIPLGFFLPLLYKKYHSVSRVALTGFLFSLSIEIVQMFGMGSTDINDLITNTAGACAGYYIYGVVSKLVRKELRGKCLADKINDHSEMLFFVLYSFIVMVTIQPFIMHKLFRLG